MKLTVNSARPDDVYKDIVRIHRGDRGQIRAGRICKITVEGRSRYFIVRGLPQSEAGQLLMDENSREALGVALGEQYEFVVKAAGPIGKLVWACTLADPGPRIAAWLAIWSVSLGLAGVLLSIWALS